MWTNIKYIADCSLNLVPRTTCKGPGQDGGQIKNGGSKVKLIIFLLNCFHLNFAIFNLAAILPWPLAKWLWRRG